MEYSKLKKDELIKLLEEKEIKYQELMNFNTQLINEKSDIYFKLSKYELDYDSNKIKVEIEEKSTSKAKLKEISLELLVKLQAEKNKEEKDIKKHLKTVREKKKLNDVKRVNEYMGKIAELIKDNNKISITEIAKELGITRKTLYNLKLGSYIEGCRIL